jgi:hypothetical protein
MDVRSDPSLPASAFAAQKLNGASSVGRLNAAPCRLQAGGRGADTLPMKLRSSCARGAWVCAACLLLSACGGAQEHSAGGVTGATNVASHGASTAVRAATTSAAASPPSRAQALAFARAVNLTAGDIPEASVERKPDRGSSAGEKQEYRACEKLAGPGRRYTVAEASSPKLRRGQELEAEQITSSVTVLSNERAVALTAMSATQPVPASTEQELLALLLTRARAHAL